MHDLMNDWAHQIWFRPTDPATPQVRSERTQHPRTLPPTYPFTHMERTHPPVHHSHHPSSRAEQEFSEAIALKEEHLQQLGLGPRELQQLYPRLSVEVAVCYLFRSRLRFNCLSKPHMALADALRALEAREPGWSPCFVEDVAAQVAMCLCRFVRCLIRSFIASSFVAGPFVAGSSVAGSLAAWSP
jgi:hypothetical protein